MTCPDDPENGSSPAAAPSWWRPRSWGSGWSLDQPGGGVEVDREHRADRTTSARHLGAACEEAGLDPAGAVLVRLGSNAVFRLADPVIARISRDGGTLENARLQIEVARWLDDVEYLRARIDSLRTACADLGFALEPEVVW